jgi:hypothetical protein
VVALPCCILLFFLQKNRCQCSYRRQRDTRLYLPAGWCVSKRTECPAYVSMCCRPVSLHAQHAAKMVTVVVGDSTIASYLYPVTPLQRSHLHSRRPPRRESAIYQARQSAPHTAQRNKSAAYRQCWKRKLLLLMVLASVRQGAGRIPLNQERSNTNLLLSEIETVSFSVNTLLQVY